MAISPFGRIEKDRDRDSSGDRPGDQELAGAQTGRREHRLSLEARVLLGRKARDELRVAILLARDAGGTYEANARSAGLSRARS